MTLYNIYDVDGKKLKAIAGSTRDRYLGEMRGYKKLSSTGTMNAQQKARTKSKTETAYIEAKPTRTQRESTAPKVSEGQEYTPKASLGGYEMASYTVGDKAPKVLDRKETYMLDGQETDPEKVYSTVGEKEFAALGGRYIPQQYRTELPEDFVDRDLKFSEYLSLVDQIKSASSEVSTGAKQTYESMKLGLKNIQNQMKLAGEDYSKNLANMLDAMKQNKASLLNSLERFQAETGSLVDVANPAFQQAILEAEAEGKTNYNDIFKKYKGQPMETDEGLAQLREQIKSKIDQAESLGVDRGQIDRKMQQFMRDINQPGVSRTLARQNQIQFLDDQIKLKQEEQTPEKGFQDVTRNDGNQPTLKEKLTSPQSLNNTLENSPNFSEMILKTDWENMSSIDSLKLVFAKEFEMLNSNKISNMYDEQIKAYEQAKVEADNDYEDDLEEIQKAISGKDFVPTSIESLNAKILADTKEAQLESIDIEKEYMDQNFDLVMKEERVKRGRLEGYLKSKLFAMDSSAGMQVLSSQVNAADTRLMMMENEHKYAMAKLNLESRNVMTNYANQSLQLNLQIKEQQEQVQAGFDKQILALKQDKIKGEQEKELQKVKLFKDFQKNLYTIQKDNQNRMDKLRKEAYDQQRDKINDAYKLAGLTGVMYGVNGDGDIQAITDQSGNPVPTFAAEKYQDSKMLDWAKFEWSQKTGVGYLLPQLSNQDPNFVKEFFSSNFGMDLGAMGYKGKMTSSVKKAIQSSFKDKADLFQAKSLGQGLLSALYDDGSTLPSSFDKLQCGEFVRKMINIPLPNISAKADKEKLINISNKQDAMIGDVAIFNNGANGHIGVVNRVERDASGNAVAVILTEANANGDGLISNTRRIPLDEQYLVGFGRHGFSGAIEDYIGKNSASLFDYVYGIQGVDSIPKTLSNIKNTRSSAEYNAVVRYVNQVALTQYNDNVAREFENQFEVADGQSIYTQLVRELGDDVSKKDFYDYKMSVNGREQSIDKLTGIDFGKTYNAYISSFEADNIYDAIFNY